MSVKTISSPSAQTRDNCFVACASGLEKTLHNELKSLGIKGLRLRRAGVDVSAGLRDIYKICLWSRVANRLLYPLTAFKVADEKSFYNGLLTIDWSEHLSESGTLAVDFYTADSVITHSQYGAQLTKDAVVDWFREKTGQRPNVDRDTPDIRINVYLYKNRARVSLDMAGSSLHRRNYRNSGGKAPIKENLAAALLLAANWSGLAKHGSALTDPMCGSATLLIEAAMIAANIAPGLQRDYFGFLGWLQHDAQLWQEVMAEAREAVSYESIPSIVGTDIDSRTITVARENIKTAGLEDYIKVSQADFFELVKPLENGPGLVVVNPPYGERLENEGQIGVFYSKLGRTLRRCAGNWQLALFTGNPALFHRTGLSRRVVLECTNGGIDCRLFLADIPPPPVDVPVGEMEEQSLVAQTQSTKFNPWAQARPSVKTEASIKSTDEPNRREPNGRSGTDVADAPPGLDQFSDRLRKNLRQLKGWAKSAGITNYRVYDADLPDYAFALDIYQGDPDADNSGPFVCLQEYKAPAHIDPVLAQRRIDGAANAVADILNCRPENLAVKRRERQRAESQYTRLEKRDVYHKVLEGECVFLINIHDYLDSGLFLDHRKVRQWLAASAQGCRLLNLYCYTSTATIHAAVAGARESISVDLSHKYLEWSDKNFALNGLDKQRHKLVHGDCRSWLENYQKDQPKKFDIIFLDPPTFSNSTSMEQDWDVQRDHESMIRQCMLLLEPDGTMVFSNNFRRFKLAESILSDYRVRDRSKWSIQRDFARNPRIHQCWFIQHTDQ